MDEVDGRRTADPPGSPEESAGRALGRAGDRLTPLPAGADEGGRR